MRCRCCNYTLKSSEIIWYPKEQRHEDLCAKCRSSIFSDLLNSGYDVEKIGMYIDDAMEVEDDST